MPAAYSDLHLKSNSKEFSQRVEEHQRAGRRGRRRREKLVLYSLYTPQLHPFFFQPLYCCNACVCFQVQQFQRTEDLDSPPCHCFHSQILLLFNLIFYVGELYLVLFWSCYWRLTEMAVSRGNSPDSFFLEPPVKEVVGRGRKEWAEFWSLQFTS